MSIHTKRVIGYSLTIWIILLLVSFVPLIIMVHGQEHFPATADAAPLPWWQQVESFQALALKWIASLTAVVVALVTFLGVIVTQYKNLKERMDRITARNDAIQAVTIIATAKQEPKDTNINP